MGVVEASSPRLRELEDAFIGCTDDRVQPRVEPDHGRPTCLRTKAIDIGFGPEAVSPCERERDPVGEARTRFGNEHDPADAEQHAVLRPTIGAEHGLVARGGSDREPPPVPPRSAKEVDARAHDEDPPTMCAVVDRVHAEPGRSAREEASVVGKGGERPAELWIAPRVWRWARVAAVFGDRLEALTVALGAVLRD
jgi:hypothetical protein